MKIIINPTNKYKLPSKLNVKNYDILLSHFKGDKKRYLDSTKHNYLPMGTMIPATINNAFWIINNKIDSGNFKNISEIVIINSGKGPYEKFEGVEISKDLIIITNIDLIRKPMIVYYDKHLENQFNNYIIAWLQTNNLKTNENGDIPENFEDKIMPKISTLKQKNIVNIGNEGTIYFLNKRTKFKLILKAKNINKKLKDRQEYKKLNVFHAIDKIKDFLPNVIDKIKIENDIKIYFKNIIFPTDNINYSMQAHSLIKQMKHKIIIDDNKKENYGKYLVSNRSGIFKIVYNDFGSSFIKINNNHDYNKYFAGIVRDYYYLVKNRNNVNAREIIRDRRVYDHSEIKDERFQKFFNFVMKKYKYFSNNYACKLKSLPVRGVYRFCHEDNNSTLYLKRKNNYILNLTNIETDDVYKCNCKTLIQDIKRKKDVKYELGKDLILVKDSWEVNFD